MTLNHTQKNYIKKHLKQQGLSEISQELNIPEQEIINYLGRKWDKNKLNTYLDKGTVKSSEQHSNIKDLFTNHWINLLILSALVILTYAFFLNNAFVSDDIAEIAQKPEIANFSRILQFPTGPIRHIIYFVAVSLGGVNPFLFRLTNLLFHLFSSYLIYIVLFLIYEPSSSASKSKRTAFFASCLFAVHPAISEAVLWISGGMYAQYSFFFLLSLVFYIKSENNKKYYLTSVITYLFSLMSHPQMPIPLFIIYPLYDFCFRNNFKKTWVRAIPFLILSLVYVFISLGALPAREATLQNVHYQEKGVDNIFTLIPVAISSYAELLFFPKILTLYHSELAFGNLSFAIRAFFTILFFAGFAIAFKKSKSVFFWLCFSLIALSPTLTPFRLNWIVAERYIYLPSVGIFALVSLGLERLILFKKKYSNIILAAFAIVILLLSIRTFMRGIDWENEDNLWIATGKTSLSSPNTHNNLGDVYGRHGDKEGALKEFSRAIELKPNYADAYHNLGNTYREMGNLGKAMESYLLAAKLNPNLWQSYQNIAALYFQAKQYDLALENIEQAIKINPKNLNLYNNLGVIYLTKGDKTKAKEIFMQVLTADPQNQFAKAGLTETNK